MRYLVLLLLPFVVGCMEIPETSLGSKLHDIMSDVVDAETGLTIVAPAYDVYISNKRIVDIYKEVERCTNLEGTKGPKVHFVNFSDYYWGSAWGFLHVPEQSIYINVDSTETHVRNLISDEDSLRHEFVHYVLLVNGLDYHHTSVYFEKCNATGVKTCDGQACR